MKDIAYWLRRVRADRDPGPATCIATRAAGQVSDFITLPICGELDTFAERLDHVCRDHAGDVAKRSYLFTARDESGAKVGVMRYTVRRAQRAAAAPRTRLTMLVEESLSQATHLSREFGGLGLDAILTAWKAQDRVMARLQAENQELRKEVDDLRAMLQCDRVGSPKVLNSKR
jgi:hypothetical protein